MFTGIIAKKTLFTLIGALLVLCSFSTIGCSGGALSELDKQVISLQSNMEVLKDKNTQLTKENAELKKENKDLKGEIRMLQLVKSPSKKLPPNTRRQFSPKVNPSSPQEETPPSPPDLILGVDDELPDFRNDINWASSSPIVYMSDAEISGRKYRPYIRFKKQGEWLELKNGTRYICTTRTGCEIIDFVITEGTIEVHHNKNGN